MVVALISPWWPVGDEGAAPLLEFPPRRREGDPEEEPPRPRAAEEEGRPMLALPPRRRDDPVTERRE